jgi:predicted transcriptional regulator
VKEESSALERLEDYYAMRIILYLHRNGQSVRTVVYARAANSPNTARVKIDRMIANGLISEIEEEIPPKRKWIELTDKGKKVAEHLLEIEEILTE